jgi:glutamine amidotransferase
MGNLRSVQKALEKVGADVELTTDPQQVAEADKLVLPGVGAFEDAMRNLREAKLIEPIRDYLRSGKPFLGICLGLQMLFDVGYEDGEHAGLGIFPGKVVRFQLPPELKVPHMGWNQLQIRKPSPILAGLESGADVYFVHSYYVVPDDRSIIATETDYGGPFTSMIQQDRVFATQFHPEKSQRVGLGILQRFAELQ